MLFLSPVGFQENPVMGKDEGGRNVGGGGGGHFTSPSSASYHFGLTST